MCFGADSKERWKIDESRNLTQIFNTIMEKIMKKTLIVYGSTTGNTEMVANWIKDELEASGEQADLFDAAEIKPETVLDYSLIVLGSSTWGTGEIQDDFAEFYDAMSYEHFKGKKVAVFGCGDSDMFPDYFCQAVDMIAEKAIVCGADVALEVLKIDGDIDSYKSDAQGWAKRLI
jgi:flavodoxin I